MIVNTEAATQSNLLPDGQYEAVIKRAEEKISSNGNGMIELILTVYGPNDQAVDVFDWLLADDQWQWKVKQCCDSAGIDYTSELDERDFMGKNVRVNLIQRAKTKGDKRKLHEIPEAERSNGIKGYLLRTSEHGAPVSAVKVNRPVADDEGLPF